MKLTKKQIAKRARISARMLHYILSGKRAPSRKTAILLERATGTKRDIWMFGTPEELSRIFE
ncbi:MAG TPA: helix-turn-helix domain-containing protein [Desulfobacterales bacterium]|nr:helix-turn-helix domain-containing protein [Desulfobacterales bacterium]